MIVKIDQLPKKNIDEAFDELTERPVPPDIVELDTPEAFKARIVSL
jgi:hypothetical protein